MNRKEAGRKQLSVNRLKPNGNYMYHLLSIKKLYLYVYYCYNKQGYLRTALMGIFLYCRTGCVFCAVGTVCMYCGVDGVVPAFAVRTRERSEKSFELSDICS